MNLDAIVVDPAEAEAKLAEYQAAADWSSETDDGTSTAHDAALVLAYRAARRGHPLIRLSQVIAAGGWFGDGPNYGLPRLAVCRADARQCAVRTWGDDLLFADGDSWMTNRGALVNRDTVRVPGITRPPWRQGMRNHGTTLVPLTPPAHRPRRPRRMSSCHVLWEVEDWSATPPRDPALLRHIRGDLWVVLAVWDLTELERAVLAIG